MKKRITCFLLTLLTVVMLCPSILAASKLPSMNDSKYIQTYALKSSGKIYGYKDEALTKKATNWINPAKDECWIIKISANKKAVYISYPLDKGGRSKAWFSRAEFSASNLAGSFDYKTFYQKVTTYRRSDGKQSYGYAAVNDKVYILGKSGNFTQIVYPLSGGKWKLGWAKTADVNNAVKEPASTLKITGASKPTTITQGSGFTVKGTISSNYTITKVTVGIYDASGKKVSEKTVNPNSTSYNINKIDSDIHFGQAKVGTNYYRVVASDKKASNRQLINQKFTVNPKTEPQPNPNPEPGTFAPVWPCATSYKVTCLYYYKDGTKHSTRYGYTHGMDIAGGGKIVAVESGTIETVTDLGNTSFGKYIVILHSNGSRSLYAHLSSFASGIKKGATVKKGQTIGTMGSTGNSSGTHLHFEMSKADPWNDYFKSDYRKKISFEQNVRSNNVKKKNTDAASKRIVNWIDTYYKKSGTYYVAK